MFSKLLFPKSHTVLWVLAFALFSGNTQPKADAGVVSFFSKNTSDEIVDPRDGSRYRTVEIGNLRWLAENLRLVTPGSECYENLDSNCLRYGRLYPFEERLNACPPGWRLPTVADWKTLREAAGTKKAAPIVVPGVWLDKKFDKADNRLGLSILPGGRKDPVVPKWRNSLYGELGVSASFWLDDPAGEQHWHVRWGKNEIHKHGKLAGAGHKFSIRCVCEKQ